MRLYKNKFFVSVLVLSVTIYFMWAPAARADSVVDAVTGVFDSVVSFISDNLMTVIIVATIVLAPEVMILYSTESGIYWLATESLISYATVLSVSSTFVLSVISAPIVACLEGWICPSGSDSSSIVVAVSPDQVDQSACQFQIPATFYIPSFNQGYVTGPNLYCYYDLYEEQICEPIPADAQRYMPNYDDMDYCATPDPNGTMVMLSGSRCVPVTPGATTLTSIDETQSPIAVYRVTAPVSQFQTSTGETDKSALVKWFTGVYGSTGLSEHNFGPGLAVYENGGVPVTDRPAENFLAMFDYLKYCSGNKCVFPDVYNVPENSYVFYAAKILGNYIWAVPNEYSCGDEDTCQGTDIYHSQAKFLKNTDNYAELAAFPWIGTTAYSIGDVLFGPLQTGPLTCPQTAINGSCGSSNGASFNTIPTTNLCDPGTASTVSGSGPWTWTCSGSDGGADAPCGAFINTYNLSVSKSGTGSGAVNPSAGSLNWSGNIGTASYNYNSSFTLTAIPSDDSYFAGWSGSCSNTTGPCDISMTQARSVTATFNLKPILTVTRSGNGFGSVIDTAPGGTINCGLNCSNKYNLNTSITLSAIPLSNSYFSGWTGACSGTGSCTVTMDVAKTVNAQFTLSPTYTISPASATKQFNQTQQFTGYYDSDGPAGSQTPLNYTYYATWSSSNTAVATVNNYGSTKGLATCKNTSGTVTITSTYTSTYSVLTSTASLTCGSSMRALNVTKSGNGSGTIYSSDGKINCGSDCKEDYTPGKSVTLYYYSAPNSYFTGWSGACSGYYGSCIVSMNDAKSVNAAFTLLPTYVISPVSAVKQINQTQQFTGYYDSDGPSGSQNPLNYTYYANWTSSNTAVATINNNYSSTKGLATCKAPGSTTITSTYSGRTSTAILSCSIIPSYTLNVAKSGTGSGTISSSPAGITCGSDCRENYTSGTPVTLTAAPDAGSSFMGWSGACSGANSSCVVSMTQQKDVLATFITNQFTLTVIKSGAGLGSLNASAGILNWSGNTGTAAYNSGASVTITATPASGSTFSGWSGACSGSDSSCSVSMNDAKSVNAEFRLSPTYVISPASASKQLNQTQQFIGYFDSDGPNGSQAQVDVTNSAAWSFSKPAIASITNSGLATCSAVGSPTITSVYSGITATASLVCSAQPTLSVTITANPPSGTAPLNTTLTASVSGSATGNINYSFWWNCNNDTTSISVASASCGGLLAPNPGTCVSNANGAKCDNISVAPKSIDHTYSNIGGYRPKVIVERGTAPAAQDLTDSGAQSPDTRCTGPCPPPPICTTGCVVVETPTYPVTGTISGTGSGTITDTVPGGTINCGSDCSENYTSGTVVTLAATADANSTFMGWSGDCLGAGSCIVSVTRPINVTATFNISQYNLNVSKSGTGSGTVTSNPAGINCGSDCSENYPSGTVVTLAATADANSTFMGWSGDCLGAGSCVVTVTRPINVTATFNISQYPVTGTISGTGTGSGTITDTVPGGTINCGSDCSETYPSGTSVTLVANPGAGSYFAGWTGDCSGTGSCVISVIQPINVTATFNFSPNFTLNSSNTIYATLVSGQSGQSNTSNITVTPLNGFSSNVALSVQSVTPSLPAGTTYYFSDSTLSSSEYSQGSQFRVNIGAGLTSSGSYLIKIRGVDGGLINTVDLYLNIQIKQPGWEEF